jgi:hypothetical protein
MQPVESFDIVDYLCQHVEFDIEHGPYIAGSALTRKLAQQFYPVVWQCKDIDIICRTIEQQNYLDKMLTPLSVKRQYSVVDYFKNKLLHHTDRINWTVQGFDISSSIHNVNAQTRADLHDYTVACIAGDGKTFYTVATTIEDIKNKILRRAPLYHTDGIRTSPGIYEQSPGPIVTNKVIERYQRYVSRGFVDIDNIKEKLQQETGIEF